jgi:hypothetical protein
MAQPPGTGANGGRPAQSPGEKRAGRTRRRPSRLTDASVAVLLLIADGVIVVTGVLLFVFVGMSRSEPPIRPENVTPQDTPVGLLVIVWGVPVVAAISAALHARLRMPITAAVQTLFTLVCAVLATAWTRMLLA